jgi:hypothetical protein
MKTTLDLADDLLIEAKALAARQRTTLREIVERALRRELAPSAAHANPDPEKFEVGPFGILRLKRQPDAEPLTPEKIRTIQAEIDEEEFQRATNPRRQ